MNYLRVKGVPFTIAGKTYELAFSLNVMADIYDKYGSTTAFMKEFNAALKSPLLSMSIFKWVLCVLVNDAIDEQNAHAQEKTEKLTERQIGRLLRVKDYAELQQAVVAAWRQSMPESEESDEDDEETESEEEAGKN
jgi:hypothetical protein